ncbi:MAG: hypothetical protein VYD64_00815, partial [Pseudomonadota bacterium]|nr:hypothetical protein [Pseudomonadota bacterium]
LFEGAAVHLSLAINDGLIHGSDEPVADLRTLARYREFQNHVNGAGAYVLSWRAVRFLAGKTSPETVWTQYWKVRGAQSGKVRWEKTFEEVFGMPPDTVYKLFGTQE